MRELLDPKAGPSFLGGGAGYMARHWGRYTRTSADPAKKPVTGRCVTVWRKNAGGEWRAVMDIGRSG
jgi:ketosteroid isomerase-like protein